MSDGFRKYMDGVRAAGRMLASQYGPGGEPGTPSKQRYDGRVTSVSLADHEMGHTYQYPNPLFVTRYILGGIVDKLHGKPNRYENEADDFAEEVHRRRTK